MVRKVAEKAKQEDEIIDPVAPVEPEGTDTEPETPEPVQDEPEETPASMEDLAPSAPAAIPSPALAIEAPVGSKARAMKEKLAAQPKVRVFIPLAPGEKQGVTQSVVLNGYPMYIRKGSYVDVPQAVAEVLETKMKHKMSVENHPSRIAGDRPVKMTNYGN